ncbi:MAG TPA: hypothetical protein VHA52_01270 [Candidatus Babeliaceae bacterium]|nr:hypothetical protein [Candidatus Babeliaceae bacterium]
MQKSSVSLAVYALLFLTQETGCLLYINYRIALRVPSSSINTGTCTVQVVDILTFSNTKNFHLLAPLQKYTMFYTMFNATQFIVNELKAERSIQEIERNIPIKRGKGST